MTLIYITLGIAILLEVIGTTALAACQGFTRLWPSLICVGSYGIAIYLLTRTLAVLPVGIVYATWSGAGMVLIALAGWFYHRQALDLPAIVGIGLIICGVLVMHLFSDSVPH
ncbi:MAG: SMR family transporter [Rhodospirillales bacterium]